MSADCGSKHLTVFGPYLLTTCNFSGSLINCPPLYMYCAAKAGALCLMWGLRTKLPEKGITVNLTAPWMTGRIIASLSSPENSSKFGGGDRLTSWPCCSDAYSIMLPQWIIHLWGDLPANKPEIVARGFLIPALRHNLSGCTSWVAGKNVIELEQGLYDTQP